MMLPKFPYDSRLKKLQGILATKGVDVAVVLKPENTYYVSLFQAIIYSRPIAVIVPSEGDPTLIVPYLDLEHARERSPIPTIKHYYHEEEFYHILKEDLRDARRVGLDVDSLTMYTKVKSVSEALELVDLSKELAHLRMVKDGSEVERIRVAADITDFGMKEVMRSLEERGREVVVAARAEYAMKVKLAELLGDEGLYPWMNWTVAAVLSGFRSYYPHGMVSGRKVVDGDVVIVTLDIAVEGYRAENERTFLVGRVKPEVEEYFELMEEAQRKAIEVLRPGVLAEEPDKVSRGVFAAHNALKFVTHRTGHGIGLEIHEKPNLAEGDVTVLDTNMVLCVEPGIYVPNVGGFRHSDTVLITPDGPEVLTKTPKGINNLTV
ncbi:MAG: Xaa-Pro peptidase family protein [Thermofilaceae archaeon]